MRVPLYSSLCLLAAAAAAAAAAATEELSTSIAFQIGQPRILQQNKQGDKSSSDAAAASAASGPADVLQAVLAGIPAWTRATLEAGSGRQHVSAPVTAGGRLVFSNVTAGSYLAEVHCATHVFPPVRVDVMEEKVAESSSASGAAHDRFVVIATETYRGNDWANRGEALARLDTVIAGSASSSSSSSSVSAPTPTFVLRPLAAQQKSYYTERGGFSALSILKNPMILVALVTMGIVFGMPYLVENMDPEMRAEWEERQKSNPMNSLMGSGGGNGGGGTPAPSFDMAAYLAGSPKTGSGGGSGSSSNNAGDNGGRRNQGVRR